MPWLIPVAAAAVTAGAGIYSANKASSAAKDAASAQIAGNQAAIGEQQREFNVNQTNLAPWLAAGKAALGQQSLLLGLGAPQSGGGPTLGAINTQKLLADNPDIAAWVQAGNGDPSIQGQQSPDQAVNYWVKNGIAQGDPRAINAPTYTQADVTAGSPYDQQQAAIDNLKASPLYQSLYRNGVDTINANASATGGLRGGNIQRSLANFGSDTLASVIQQQLANLGGLSGQGANTGTNLGQLGNQTSGNISSLLSQNGGANAGGILASAGFGNAGIQGALASLLKGAGASWSAYQSANAPGPVDPLSAGVI